MSDDLEILQKDNIEWSENEILGVNLYTDIPVPKSCQGKSIAEGGSAFLATFSLLGKFAMDFYKRKEQLHSYALKYLPILRYAASHYLQKNWRFLKKQLIKIGVLEKNKSYHRFEISELFHIIVYSLFEPITSYETLLYRKNNLEKVFNHLLQNEPYKLKRLIKDFWEKYNFKNFSKQLMETTLRCFEKFDAITAGMMYFYIKINNKINPTDFLIFRNDFQELKSLYLDIFELSQKSLLYVGALYNLAQRGDAESWPNGKRITLKKFKKLRPIEKEFVFKNIPDISECYNLLNRKLRNTIGHYSVEYDFKQSRLLLENGQQIEVLEFLESFYKASQFISYLILLEWIVSRNIIFLNVD